MITPLFLGLWFFFSAGYFGGLTYMYRLVSDKQPDRDLNTLLVLLSQALGAFLAYALHP